MTRTSKLMSVIGCLLGGMAISLNAAAATATKPASPAPACCGDACRGMPHVCCSVVDKGKSTCAMGGGCCVKAESKPAESKPAIK
jgi:hypothetical protein